jgi:hypothetical protein
MQNALTDIADIKDWVKTWNYPYWRLFGGTMESRTMTMLESNMDSADILDSQARLENALNRFTKGYGGVFNILLNKDGNDKNNAGPRTNVVISADSTPQYKGGHRVAAIGATPEDVERRIAAAVDLKTKELKAEYEHKAQIAKLELAIEDLREDRRSEWSLERINGLVDAAFQNPVLQMVIAKALGVSALPTPPTAIGNPAPSDVLISGDEEKINTALDILDDVKGIGNSADVLLKVARFAKDNPDQAKLFLNQL